MKRIGIVGFGKLGKFLAEKVMLRAEEVGDVELCFVWNRRPEAWQGHAAEAVGLTKLAEFMDRKPDIIVEVAHPDISSQWGTQFLASSDYLVGSPTGLADEALRTNLLECVKPGSGRQLIVPRGALPGLDEILMLKADGRVAEAAITMRKHPKSLKYSGPIAQTSSDGESLYYKGPLGPLCGFAPNNVNTMAVLAMATGLSFEDVEATLVADPSLEHHITEVTLRGPDNGGPRFELFLKRSSPAGAGAVTSSATFDSFWKTLTGALTEGEGVKLC